MIEKKIEESAYFACSSQWQDSIIITRKVWENNVLMLYYVEKRK